jgi:hypothetical protein
MANLNLQIMQIRTIPNMFPVLPTIPDFVNRLLLTKTDKLEKGDK